VFKRISKILCNSKFFGPAPLPRHYRATTAPLLSQQFCHAIISPTLCFLLFVFGSQTTHAGVVLSSTLAGNGDSQGKVIGTSSANTNGLGIVFTTGNSSNWNLRSIQLALTTGSGSPRGTYSGGTVSFFLYTLAGTSALTANSLTYVGSSTATLNSFTKGLGVTKTLTFSGSGLNNLSAGTQYLLGMNFGGSVSGSKSGGYTEDFLKVNTITASSLTAVNSSGWTVPSGYSYMVGNYPPTGTNAFSSSTTNVAYAYTTGAGAGFILDAEAAAVPEPGTLILFGVTMAAGCAGAWLKRRKQKSE
jgi:hypothetical protein